MTDTTPQSARQQGEEIVPNVVYDDIEITLQGRGDCKRCKREVSMRLFASRTVWDCTWCGEIVRPATDDELQMRDVPTMRDVPITMIGTLRDTLATARAEARETRDKLDKAIAVLRECHGFAKMLSDAAPGMPNRQSTMLAERIDALLTNDNVVARDTAAEGSGE